MNWKSSLKNTKGNEIEIAQIFQLFTQSEKVCVWVLDTTATNENRRKSLNLRWIDFQVSGAVTYSYHIQFRRSLKFPQEHSAICYPQLVIENSTLCMARKRLFALKPLFSDKLLWNKMELRTAVALCSMRVPPFCCAGSWVAVHARRSTTSAGMMTGFHTWLFLQCSLLSSVSSKYRQDMNVKLDHL